MTNLLTALEDWYLSNCDGDWEHGFGVRIQTLDNPGWWVEIHLDGTSLEGKAFDNMEIDRSNDDWIHCRVEKTIFRGAGGPRNLEEILRVFFQWGEIER